MVLQKLVLLILLLSPTLLAYPHVPPLLIRNTGYYNEEPKKCADALTDTLLSIEDLGAAFYILSTGKYLNNWGAYGTCLDQVKTGSYWMVTTTGPPKNLENKANLTFYTGLCVPSDCTHDDMLELQELFEGAADFNDVENPFISYFSVTDYVNDRQGMPASSEILTWLIVFGFLGCIGIGTLLHITKLCDKENIKARLDTVSAAGSDRGSYNSLLNEGEVDPNAVSKQFNHDVSVLYRKKFAAIPFIAFSAVRNITKVFSSQKNAQISSQAITKEESSLQIFGGLRFYAMLWILYANTVALTEFGVVENIKDKPKMFSNFFFTFFPAAFFAADVFFFMSGFLAIYSVLKLKNLTPVTAVYQYGRRFFRIAPVIGFVMVVSMYVIPRFVEGPMCQRYNEEFEDCNKYAWANLLLINNFLPNHLNSTCMPWTWFASVDFQMFLLVPILALIYNRSKFAGKIATLLVITLGVVLTAVLNGISKETGANPYLDTAFFTDLYIKPWARGVPYFIGVYFGALFYYYSKNEENFVLNKVRFNPFIRAALYIIGLALTLATVSVLFDYTKNYGGKWHTTSQVLYATISPITFTIGVAFLILPALLGKAKLIRFLLKGPILTALGRLTFVVALGHPILMLGIYTTVGQQIYIEAYKMFTLFVGHSFLIYCVSLAANIIFELPFRGIESIWHDKSYANQMVEAWLKEKENAKVSIAQSEKPVESQEETKND